jgi:tetrahydrodipicolinate N-succinyltransferase
LQCVLTRVFTAAAWWSYTKAKAEELAAKYDKKTRYFMDVFFQDGAHMVNHQDKTNPYNAFRAEKAAQRREGAHL